MLSARPRLRRRHRGCSPRVRGRGERGRTKERETRVARPPVHVCSPRGAPNITGWLPAQVRSRTIRSGGRGQSFKFTGRSFIDHSLTPEPRDPRSWQAHACTSPQSLFDHSHMSEPWRWRALTSTSLSFRTLWAPVPRNKIYEVVTVQREYEIKRTTKSSAKQKQERRQSIQRLSLKMKRDPADAVQWVA